MGINYYLYEKPCAECGHSDTLHIGKSSAGWVFSLHIMPNAGIHDLIDWIALFLEPGRHIENEYGDVIELETMLQTIMCRVPLRKRTTELSVNHAEVGPNGLLISKVDGHHCVGHGAGTWSLHPSNFS